MNGEKIDVEMLPAVLRELAGVIGLPATVLLVQEYGGTRIHVPAEFSKDHALTRCLGVTAARALVEHHRTEPFDVPLASAALREARNADIVRRHDAGVSANTLAREYRTTRRHIFRIYATHVTVDRNLKLFG